MDTTLKKIDDISYTTDYVANGSFASLKENVEYKNKPDYAVLVRLKDYKSGWDGDFVYVSEHSYNFLKKSSLVPGDIIISNVGAYAGTVFKTVDLGRPMTLGPNSVLLRPKEDNNSYIYYFLSSKIGKSYLKSIIGGSAQPKFNKTDLRNLSIPLPPLPTQQKIASILSSYDNLIENNTRRIQILEEMAQRIYKEWFVDFKYPGHENDQMVDSELGMIPEGWLCNFYDVVDFKEGPGLRNWQYRDEGIPFLNIRTLIKNDIDLTKVQYLDPQEVEKKYQHFLLEENDHVVSSSGTLGRIATIRKDHLPLMLNTSIIRMRPKANNMGIWQLKHFMMSKYFQHQINAFAIGSAQPNYGPSHLKQMSIIAPTKEISDKYENKVSSFEKLINLLVKKNNIFTKTRDYLLPKLISGKIDVSDLDIDTSIIND